MAIEAVDRKSTSRTASPELSQWAIPIMAGLSGFVTFILEVMWGRMFAQVHENSIHSFAVVLAVFLLGLSAGANLVRHLLSRGLAPDKLLAFAWLSGGIAALGSAYLFYWLTNGLSFLKGNGGWVFYGAQIIGLCVPTVFLPILLCGMALPLLMELAGRNTTEPNGRVLGRLLAINTAGSIAGSLAAAFVLPAVLGLWSSIVLCGVAMCFAGGWSLGGWVQPRRFGGPTWAVCALAILVPVLLDPSRLPRTKISIDSGERLISLTEGSHGIVAVIEANGSRRIKLDNFYVLGGTASTGDERMQSHLPLLLHPAPKRVAFLGFGTGITAGAALLHPVEQILAIEIVPEVVRAARNSFAEANLGAITDPRVEMIVDDARNVLQSTERKFDVIVGDLVVPWRKGESALYTLEHFQSARRALASSGLFCQWLPLFQLSEAEFNIVAATFLSAFPQTTVWRGDFAPDRPALALIGRTDDAPIDPAAVEQRLRELKADEANPSLRHPAGFWMFLAGPLDPKEVRFARAPRNRENKPWLEIVGPLRHAGSLLGDSPLFVGRRLETYLNELRARPLAGTPLARLGPAHLQWRDAGAMLGSVSILTVEGNRRDADALLKQAILALPPQIRNDFSGTAPLKQPTLP